MLKSEWSKKLRLITSASKAQDTAAMDDDQRIAKDAAVEQELAGRFASLFMICYQRRDISGMHIALTAFTHTLHALHLWAHKVLIKDQMRAYILHAGFPVAESKALDWLLNHYFESDNNSDESVLLQWYQSLDDEWVLRKKLREMFPDKQSSELTPLIAEELLKSENQTSD